MDKRKGLLFGALSILLASALCLCLYRFDNKYTRTDTQPISGILFYEKDMQMCYLTRQWTLYPDVLLTPETADDYSGYRCYTDIGGESLSGKGSATYCLTLLLPESGQEYALELPEVFSSCKLYLNDKLLLQLGDPLPEGYQEGLRSRVVTFTASGKTELLLAVSDHSGVNRGLTYPPAFGCADAVLAAREARLLLHGGMTLLALLGALMAVSFGLIGDRVRGLLTGLLCLFLAVVTGYPLYHGLITLPIQPWYTLEPACYYGLLLSALLLQGAVYEIEWKYRLLLAAPGAVGLLTTLVRFGAGAIMPEDMAQLFSVLSLVLKYYTAACLLGSSVWALWREKCHSALLLCGSAAFAACLVWDRLLPLYEPIRGGWFGEIGGVLLVLALSASTWLDAADAYRFRLTYATNFHQMEQRLAQQKEHYSQLSRQIQLTKEASHDLRHHMRTMRGLAEQGNWDRLEQYLKEYEPHVRERDITLWSDHPTADAVLSYYAAIAREKNISYDVKLAIPADISIPDAELCILLSNLLENAIEAIGRQSHGPRRIYLRGEASDGRFGLVVDNTFNGELHEKNGVFYSAKHPGPGLGLRSVQTIVEKYSGLSDVNADERIFHVSILIPL